jgi:hypothetical protein
MPTEQYHEPTDELSDKTRTFARMVTSLIEEAEAINWYEQRHLGREEQGCEGDHAKCTEGRVQALSGWIWNFFSAEEGISRDPEGNSLPAGDIVEHGEEAEDSVD